ncbi:MAG: 6-carboxytetrahydropterin synthase QueD [Syntrophaceae bacterium]|nr:6-carboxytetrahydropterin synthase QueD [Syntrophaceae bacterium]
MYDVTIRKTFSAAHLLKEIGGKCEALHGHNFVVEVTVRAAALNGQDLLVDFREVKGWTQEILDRLDHRYLNELDFFRDCNPSSERIARFLFEQLAPRAQSAQVTLAKVTVWESENAKVSYSL